MTEIEQSEKEMLVELAVNAVNNQIEGEGSCSISDFRGIYALVLLEVMGLTDEFPILLSDIQSDKEVRTLLYKRFHDLKNYALKM